MHNPSLKLALVALQGGMWAFGQFAVYAESYSRPVSASATGANAVAIGESAAAAGNASTAVGNASKASRDSAVAIGNAATASSDHGIAIGQQAKARAQRTIGLGQRSDAAATDAVALGTSTRTSGRNAIAIGRSSKANQRNATALGAGSTASGTHSAALGTHSRSSNNNSIAIGTGSNASGTNSTAIGLNSSSSQTNAVSLGTEAQATQTNAIAIGANSQSLGTSGLAIGSGAFANGANATAIGPGAKAAAGQLALGQSGTNYIFQGLAYNSSDLKPPETTPCTVNTSGYVYAYVQNGSNTVYYAYVNSTSNGQPCYQNIPSSAISNTSTGVSYQTTNTTSYYNTTTMPGLGWNQITNPNYSMLSAGITSNGQMRISYANSSSNGTWFQNAATGAVFYGTNSVSSQTNCSQTYTTVSGVNQTTGMVTYNTNATSNSCIPQGNLSVSYTYNSTSNSWNWTQQTYNTNATSSVPNTPTTNISSLQNSANARKSSVQTTVSDKTSTSSYAIASGIATISSYLNQSQVKPSAEAARIDTEFSNMCTSDSETFGGTLLAADGDGLLSVTGDAEAIQVTSIEADEFSGEVTSIILDGSVDCGGICGGGGSVDGNAELIAGGEIEMTDVNMDAVDLIIETEGDASITWLSELGDQLQIYSCGDTEGGVGALGGSSVGGQAVAIGLATLANGSSTAIGS